MKTRIWAILLFIFFGRMELPGQTPCKIQLAGSIRSAADSSIGIQAELFIEKLHRKVKSDYHGHFEINNLCRDVYLLELEIPGTGHHHLTVDLQSDTFIALQLVILEETMSQVIILRQHQQTDQINTAKIIDMAGKNLAENLELLPGVTSLKTGNSIAKPMVQGMFGLRVPIFVNGVKMEGQQWGLDHAPEADALGFDALEIRGGCEMLLLTSGGFGGVLELKNKYLAHPGETDVQTGIGFQSNSGGIHAFSRLQNSPFTKNYKWFLNLSANASGNYKTPEYRMENTGQKQYNAAAGLKWSNNGTEIHGEGNYYYQESGIFSLTHIGNVQDLEKIISGETKPGNSVFTYDIQAPRQSVSHGLAKVGYLKKRNGSQLSQMLSLQMDQRREYEIFRNPDLNFPVLDISLLSPFYEFKIEKNLPKNTTLFTGIQGTAYINRYGGYYFIPDYNGINGAIYSMIEKKSGWFQHSAAVRYEMADFIFSAAHNNLDVDTEKKYKNWSASIQSIYQKRKSQYRISASRLFRIPWANELLSAGVHHGAASFEQGNATLKPEIGYKAELAVKHGTSRLDWYASAFATYFTSYINLTPDSVPVLTVRGAFPAYHYQQFAALFSGFTAQLNWHIKKWVVFLNPSLVYARNLDQNNYPAYLPPAQLRTGIQLENRKYFFNANCMWVAKQIWYTPNSDYLPPPEGYALFNAEIKFPDLFKKQATIISISANNILNTKYRNYLDRFRYYADGMGFNLQVKIIYNLHHHKE